MPEPVTAPDPAAWPGAASCRRCRRLVEIGEAYAAGDDRPYIFLYDQIAWRRGPARFHECPKITDGMDLDAAQWERERRRRWEAGREGP